MKVIWITLIGVVLASSALAQTIPAKDMKKRVTLTVQQFNEAIQFGEQLQAAQDQINAASAQIKSAQKQQLSLRNQFVKTVYDDVLKQVRPKAISPQKPTKPHGPPTPLIMQKHGAK